MTLSRRDFVLSALAATGGLALSRERLAAAGAAAAAEVELWYRRPARVRYRDQRREIRTRPGETVLFQPGS
jgi:hypothetical protein